MKKLFTGMLLMLFSVNLFSQSISISKLDSLFDIIQVNDQAMGSITISKDNEIVYQRAIGYSCINNKEKIPATADTKYRIGSITKLFTSILIFRLIEEGRLTLNTTLDKYFPEIPHSNLITIKMLLQHRSGLADYVNDPVNADPSWLLKPQTKRLILGSIKKGKPHFEPGEKVKYCNSGYYLLARIIEKIGHDTYNNILNREIIRPLHLQHTNTDSITNPGKHEAFSYYFDGTWRKEDDFCFNNLVGVGNVLSNPADLVKLLSSLFSDKLINEKSLHDMLTFPDTVNQFEYGVGIIKLPYKKDNISKTGYGHNGGTFGTYSVAMYFPVDSLAVAICLNGSHSVGDYNKIALSVLNICYNEPVNYKQYVRYPTPSSAQLDNYLGTYTTSAAPLKLFITKDSLGLIGQLSGQKAYHYEAIGRQKFELKMAAAVLDFTAPEGEVLLLQEGQKVLFKKIK